MLSNDCALHNRDDQDVLSYRLAPIETLPTEIIQDIFLQNMNISLPLASPIIASKLESHHVYNSLCDYAFYYNIPPSTGKRNGWIAFQSQILAMRWLRWDFFRDYLSSRVPPRPCGCSIVIDCHEKGGCKEMDSQSTTDSVHHNDEELCQKVLIVRCSLPKKLLRGPWTEDKTSFLRCLLRISKSSVDWSNKDAVRLAGQGKREAIMERNLDAVHLFSRTRRLGRAPTLEIVKFAVLEAGCNRSIVLNLMVAAREWGQRQWNDIELDAWVVRQEAKGDPKGRWLRIKLEELRAGRYPDLTTGDYIGDVLNIRNSPFRVSFCLPAVKFGTDSSIGTLMVAKSGVRIISKHFSAIHSQ
jgi:hypothetical protein